MTAEQEKTLTDLINTGFNETYKNQRIINGNVQQSREDQMEPTLINTQTIVNVLAELSQEVQRLRVKVTQLVEKLER